MLKFNKSLIFSTNYSRSIQREHTLPKLYVGSALTLLPGPERILSLEKALLLCRTGLLLLLSLVRGYSLPGSGVIDQSAANALILLTAVSAFEEIAQEPVSLADGLDLIIDDEVVPLSEGFSQSGELCERLAECVNSERKKAGLDSLEISALLQSAAAVRAAELEELYSHTRPDGREWVSIRTDFNIPGRGIGENLNKNLTTPESVITSWMNSADHKTNVLTPDWNLLGVGVHVGSDGTMFWAILFTD